MADFKIFVKDEAASKEAQELLFKLEYKWRGGIGANYLKLQENLKYITAYSHDMVLGQGEKGDADKEITLAELRDLVVLKRNDVNDATHINTRTNTPYLKQGDKEYYMYKDAWFLSDCPKDLKPINKSETMKEHLNEKYELITSKEELSNLIKVPEGAEIAYIYGDNTYFAKPGNNGEGVLMWVLGEDTKWDKTGWKSWDTLINQGFEIVWQRNKAKEFLDPEDGYSLVTAVHALPHWIEVPEGAEILTVGIDQRVFWKGDLSWNIDGYETKEWRSTDSFPIYMKNYEKTVKVLWQRNAPTQQPEKLISIPVEDEAANNTMNDSDFMNLIGQILGNEFTDIQKTLINLALNK